MPIPEHVSNNFKTLCRAVDADRVAIMECTDAKTGEPTFVICAVQIERPAIIAPGVEPEYIFVPFARLFSGNPYEEVLPPVDEQPTEGAANDA